MTYNKNNFTQLLHIPALAPLPAGASITDIFSYYRREKARDRRLARSIDACGGEADIDALRSALDAREAVLSPIGAQISDTIVRLPSINAQLALELRYLECLTVSETAAEMRYSRSGVQQLIRRSLCQLRMLESPSHSKNKQEESDL